MKRINKVLSLATLILVAIMLTGCLSIDMKVGKNGSLDMTYTIDTSQTQGMMSFKDSADKKIAKLKSVKENKSKKTVTAIITVSDINKMGDGSFFGTVKEYRKNKGYGLDDLVNTRDKSVDEKKVSDKLQMVYFPMGGTEEYGLVEVTVTVPGNIEYLTDGAEVDKKNVAVFSGQNPLVVFKKGGRFPFWLILIIAAVVVGYFMMKKKSSSSPVSTTPVAGTSQGPVQAPPQNVAPQAPPVQAPVQPPVAAPAEPQTDSENNPT